MTKNIKVIAFMFILCACFVAPNGIPKNDQLQVMEARQRQIQAIKAMQETQEQKKACQELMDDYIRHKPAPSALRGWAEAFLEKGILLLAEDPNKCHLVAIQYGIIKELASTISQKDILFEVDNQVDVAKFHKSLERLYEISLEHGFIPKAKSKNLIRTMTNILIKREFNHYMDEIRLIIAYWALTELAQETQTIRPQQTYELSSPFKTSNTSSHSSDQSTPYDLQFSSARRLYASPATLAPGQDLSPPKGRRLDFPSESAQKKSRREAAYSALNDRLAPQLYPAVAPQQEQSSSVSQPVLPDSETPAPGSAVKFNALHSEFLTPNKEVVIATPGSHDAPLSSVSKSPHTLEPENKRPRIGDRPVASPVNRSGSGHPPSTSAGWRAESPLRKTSQPQSVPGTPEQNQVLSRQSTPRVQDAVRGLNAVAVHQLPPSPHRGSVPPMHQNIWDQNGQTARGVKHYEESTGHIRSAQSTPQTPPRVTVFKAHAQQTPLGGQPASSSRDAFTAGSSGSAIHDISPIPVLLTPGINKNSYDPFSESSVKIYEATPGRDIPLDPEPPKPKPYITVMLSPNTEDFDCSDIAREMNALGSEILSLATPPSGEPSTPPRSPIHSIQRQYEHLDGADGSQPLSSKFLSWVNRTPTPPVAPHDNPADPVLEQKSPKPTNRSLEDEFEKTLYSPSGSNSSDETPAGIRLTQTPFSTLQPEQSFDPDLPIWIDSNESDIDPDNQSEVCSDEDRSNPTDNELTFEDPSVTEFWPYDVSLPTDAHAEMSVNARLFYTLDTLDDIADMAETLPTSGQRFVIDNIIEPLKRKIFDYFIGGDKRQSEEFYTYLLRSIYAMRAWLKGEKYNL